MKGVLDDEYYQHYALLVGGIVLLSGRSISPEQLELAGSLLIHFVEMFDAHYGSWYVLMNQHMLLHLKESVLNHGPLWSSSLFVFEDWNGDISNYFHGTQNIAGQIMTAVTSQQQLPELIKEMPPGSAKDLVMRLLGQHTSALKSGSCTTEPFVDDLQAFLGLDSLSSVKLFTRLQAGSTVFHLKQYKRVSRRNTFTVAYRLDERHSLEYGQIEIFFKAPVGSRTSYGAVFKPLSRTSKGICEQHKVLGRPVSHIIALHHPHRYLLFSLKTLLISVFIWHFQTVRCIMQLIFPITWNKILIVNY